MKARAEGEVAANPLGDLSPFSPPCVDFHFTPSLCCLHFRSSRDVCAFCFGIIAEVFRHQRQ